MIKGKDYKDSKRGFVCTFDLFGKEFKTSGGHLFCVDCYGVGKNYMTLQIIIRKGMKKQRRLPICGQFKLFTRSQKVYYLH